MNDDSLFREVDEAVRQDQLKTLWDKYGVWVLLGAIALVAGVAGVNGWTYWQARQSAEAGANFADALILEEQGKVPEASEALGLLAQDGPGYYPYLARLQLAAASAKAGDKQAAIAAYEKLAEELSGDPLLHGYALIQSANLELDTAGFGAISARVGALAAGDGPWRHSARELLGFSAYRNSNRQEAEDQFGRILADQSAPLNMRRRAEMMLALLVKADANAAGQ